MDEIYVVAAKRTAIGKLGGSLKGFTAAELGGFAIKAAMDQANLKDDYIDQVLMGNVIQAGNGQNPARQAAVSAGINYSVPAITINDVCGSGLSSINLAASLIASKQAKIVIAGGMESMSSAPLISRKSRFGQRLGNQILEDAILSDALTDACGHYHMGITAENVASKYHVSRREMDEFALASHQKAVNAQNNGRFDKEITSITVNQPDGKYLFNKDEAPRKDTTIEKLGNLKPAFKLDGKVTVGNSSGINDGAAALILASKEAVIAHGLKPLARWVNCSVVGLEPDLMGMGPYYAINEVLKNAGLAKEDIDLYELNEAFAAQSLACIRKLKLKTENVNINGGAIALGHPVGASGARILVSLIYELHDQKLKKGLASLCVGGGMGVGTIIEAV